MWVDGEEWLSVADVVARLPVKAATVWSWIRRGQVRSARSGRQVWVPVLDVVEREGRVHAGMLT